MSKVMTIRLKDGQESRLGRLSRRLGKRPSETVTLLVEEALRMTENPSIDFRDTLAGRQACVKGSGLAVWEVAMISRAYESDADDERAAKIATYLNWPVTRVQAALAYARDYADEIEAAIADNGAYTLDAVRHLLPGTVSVVVPEGA